MTSDWGKPEVESQISDLRKFDSKDWTDRILDGLSVLDPGHRVDETLRAFVVPKLQAHFPTCVKRLAKLEKRLCDIFVGKDEIIRMAIVCAIAQQPMLLVGPPGTAKSNIITRMCDGLGIGHSDSDKENKSFQYLLHAFTEPDEVLGPVNLSKLQHPTDPKFERFRDGYITTATAIFLDEVFKANSAILNALLTIINERHVYEGGKAHKAMARMIYGASNTTPTARQLEELRAFYERFIIRLESTPVPMEYAQNGAPHPDRMELLRRGWAAAVDELRAGYDPKDSAMEQVACLNDVLMCNRAIAELWGGSVIEELGFALEYADLVVRLAGGERPACTIDDRKFIRLYAVARAHALYTHLGPPETKDLVIMRHVWDDVHGKERVRGIVDDFIKERLAAKATA